MSLVIVTAVTKNVFRGLWNNHPSFVLFPKVSPICTVVDGYLLYSFNNCTMVWGLFWRKLILLVIKELDQKVTAPISNKCYWFELSIHHRILGKKCFMVSTKILSSKPVFNINNNKHQNFWRIMGHLRLEKCLLKIQLCHHRNKLHFKIYELLF